jgi:hypothetical protein
MSNSNEENNVLGIAKLVASAGPNAVFCTYCLTVHGPDYWCQLRKKMPRHNQTQLKWTRKRIRSRGNRPR